MMRLKQITLALAALFFSTISLAQNIQIDQDFRILTDCFVMPAPIDVNSQDKLHIFTVTVDVSHNITGDPDNPTTLPAEINGNCDRTLMFDVYDRVGNVETFEGTVSITDPWLKGAEFMNGFSSVTYGITPLDLANAGITTSGYKVVKLRVFYDFHGRQARSIDLDVFKNSNFTCGQNLINLPGQNSLSCSFQEVGCFAYTVCDATLLVNIAASLDIVVINGIPSFGWKYTCTAFMTGGSGDFSFYWEVVEDPFATAPITSNVFEFAFSTRLIPTVILTVVDNVSGCRYTFNSSNKQTPVNFVEKPVPALLGPNPLQEGEELQVRYYLENAGTVQLEIRDLSGKLVGQAGGNFSGHAGENTLKLSTEGMSGGLYLLRMQTEAGSRTEKILVQ